MRQRESLGWQAARMLTSILLCYALVLQPLWNSLVSDTEPGAHDFAFLTVICHAGDAQDDENGQPARNVVAKQHCLLCEVSGNSLALLFPDADRTLAAPERRLAALRYSPEQETWVAPLHLPPRLSRGPPGLA